MNPTDPLKKRIRDISKDLRECSKTLFARPSSPHGELRIDEHRVSELCKDAASLIKELSK